MTHLRIFLNVFLARIAKFLKRLKIGRKKLLLHLQCADGVDLSHAVDVVNTLLELIMLSLIECWKSNTRVFENVRAHGLVALVVSAALDGFHVHIGIESCV